MKKISSFIFALLFIALGKLANAQAVTVSGNVVDNTGNSVSLAFVQDKNDNNAVRTDSLGKFTLKIDPNTTLFVSSAGYEPKKIAVKGKTTLTVVLKAQNPGATTTGDQDQNSPSSFGDYGSRTGAANGVIYGGSPTANSLLPVFKYTEATQGSRYLFKDWVTGFIIAPDDSVYSNPKYAFNYDKIGGGLLLSSNRKDAIEIDKDKIKSFTLYNEIGQPEVFEYAPDIDKTHFVQVVVGGSKYKIYKLTKTKFVKNDYHSDGMTSTGNNYDEYADQNTYYVMDMQAKQLQPLALKKKALKAVFARENEKLNSFFDMDSDSIDDVYLKKLGDYLNK